MPDTSDAAAEGPATAHATVSEKELAADLTAVVGRLMRRLRTSSSDRLLSPTQRSALSRLDRGGPMTTAALARAEYVRPQSMRGTVGYLEEQGLVERAPDPGDGRQLVVSVTGQGLAVLAEVRASKRTWLTQALSDHLTDAELRTLAESVALMERLVEES